MEKVFNLNLKAQENIIIAEKEKFVAIELKKLAKNLLKKVKTRENFVEKEIKLAQVRMKLVENNKELLENKIKSMELLKFPEAVIKNETDYIAYHEKVAKNQLELAKHHKEIAELEEKLAKKKFILANSKMHAANIRIKLGRYQLKYLTAIQKKSPKKALTLRESYKEEKRKLNHHMQDVIQNEKEVKLLQKDIADITVKLSQTLVK
ncbi:MAG: hypothetical protein ACFFA7_12995 [Promethearchaeota archaeon]